MHVMRSLSTALRGTSGFGTPGTRFATLALSFVAVVALALADGGVASAHSNARPRSSTSTTTLRSAPVKSKKVQPVLEVQALYFGNGKVRPKLISVSGEGATREVAKIVWKSWGEKTATGVGTGCVLKKTGIDANCRVTRATVVAYGLGTCGGKPAYLEVAWYFPSLGQKLTKKANTPNPSCGTETHTPPTTVSPATSTPPTTVPTTSTPTTAPAPPPSSASRTPSPDNNPAAPCTATAITAASQATTSSFYALTGFGCSGAYAFAFVAVTGPSGQIYATTQIFEATQGSWHMYHGARTAVCTTGAIPTTIYQQACQSN
jgi:hypothetical protein